MGAVDEYLNESDDDKWEEAFARSQDKLAELAEKARADVHAARARDVGIGEL